MAPRVTATDAKNNFGGLLEQVAVHGRVDITKHGRVVAVMLAPQHVGGAPAAAEETADRWGREHMIPPDRARAARMVRAPEDFDAG